MDAGPLPFGELFRERKYLRSDLRLVERAIRNGWPMPAETRDHLVLRLHELLDRAGEGLTVRETLRAVRVGLAMHEDNVRAAMAELALG